MGRTTMKTLTKITIAMMIALTAAACSASPETSYRSNYSAQGSYYFEQLDN